MFIESFVQKREPDWQKLQSMINLMESKGLRSLNSEDLILFTSLYRQASSDLNYLQTHYPSSSYTDFLNDLLLKCHAYVHIKKGAGIKSIGVFLLHGFPALIREEKRVVFFSTAIFLIASLFAFLSVYFDLPWSETLLPYEVRDDLAIRSAELEAGGPIIPEGSHGIFAGFVAYNNIQVSFFAFAGGLLAGLGTIYILVMNGTMLGSLAAYLTYLGSSLTFWTLILPHGILELAVIFIAAAAGFILGRALLIPGDYNRRDAFKIAGRKAALLLLGTIPFFILAALIEGFITPAPWPEEIKLTFAFFTLLFLAVYLRPRRDKTKS